MLQRRAARLAQGQAVARQFGRAPDADAVGL